MRVEISLLNRLKASVGQLEHFCPGKTKDIRERLSSMSWWMRLLCQRIAMRANREENETGRFWQDRYRATVLCDEASLLACAASVDLNPIRATMCDTLEDSDHTSVQRRIETASQSEHADEPERPKDRSSKCDDAFLSPLNLDERDSGVGPCVASSSDRCSDKVFLPISLADYLLLLDWTARKAAKDKRGKTPDCVPPVLKRLGLAQSNWCELVDDFGKLFHSNASQRNEPSPANPFKAFGI